ncbi:MAG: dihydrodipicolinate synthase family protein [Burkholderiales bacterium]
MPGDGGGLYSYLVTPYDAKGDVDTGVLKEYVSAMLDAGVTGVTCIASTCEGPYLTDQERSLVVDTVGKTVGGRARVNVGVGAFSTRQVIENAKRARDAGATSLMLEMQQYFPVTFEAAYQHYEAVALAVELPIRLYNLPLPTHFDFTPDRIAAMATIPAIHSVKEASGEVTRIRDIRSLCGERYKLHCGFHFQALDGFRLGAAGWEVMMHPVIARLCVDLYRTLSADPWSAQGQERYRRLEPLFHFFRQCGVPQSIKAMSEWTGLKLGKPRAPYAELSPTGKARLKQIVKDLDVL